MKKENIELIRQYEKSVGLPPDSLLKVALFETAGTLDPAIRNKYSGAVGVIQFMPSTLKGMGYTTEQVAKMSMQDQLKLADKYFRSNGYLAKMIASKDPLDVYLAVLYPKLMGKPDSAIMAMKGGKTYLQNSGLDIDKDGDIERGDIRKSFDRAVSRIMTRNKIVSVVSSNSTLLILFIFVVTLFIILKN